MEANVSPSTLLAAVHEGRQIQDSDAVRHAAIEYLRSLIRSALEIDGSEELPADVPLGELGVDSLLGLDIQDRVNEDLGVFVNPAALTDDPTLAELAGMLIGELAARPS
jgi:acyl carrier protein